MTEPTQKETPSTSSKPKPARKRKTAEYIDVYNNGVTIIGMANAMGGKCFQSKVTNLLPGNNRVSKKDWDEAIKDGGPNGLAYWTVEREYVTKDGEPYNRIVLEVGKVKDDSKLLLAHDKKIAALRSNLETMVAV